MAIHCYFSKVFEIFLFDKVSSHITEFQHCFIRGRTTTTNLTFLTKYNSEIFDDAAQVGVIYTDFPKVFDAVDHGMLLQELTES